jgi:hypothetical protein
MENIKLALDIWHTHFRDAKYQYTEFEPSDIEYFVGCMLYNYFDFEHALQTMKTIDLSYDFLQNCGDDEYKKVKEIIESIKLDTQKQKIDFLQNFIKEAQKKYNDDELYLINRLDYHVSSLAQRHKDDIKAKRVVFERPVKKANPLL